MRQAPPPAIESARIPAPTGGINTIDGGGAMPVTDSIYAYNVIGSELGLRTRLGYQEWCTGLTGSTDNTVPSIIPFTGSTTAANKLFAATSTGIWDMTASSAAPSQLIAFGITTTGAGRGSWHTCASLAGRFLLYCDEVNGLFVYSENAGTWAKISVGVTQAWAASTAYVIGNQVVHSGNIYTCDTDGTSGATGPVGVGNNEVDGTTRWDYVSAASATAIGPSLADQNAGFTADPANFVYVTVWGSRVWFVERDTSKAYYLAVNAVYGTATSFDFGSKMRAGGPLRCLVSWSYDAGNGMDTLLCGISGGGDVVIYAGSDPSSASTFGLKGCWYLGGVPAGRRIATEFGGDVLVLSLTGAITLSKLVAGVGIEDKAQYPTQKISSLYNLLAATYGSIDGWAVHIHPTDNSLMLLVPTTATAATNQLAMSLATKGWGQYRDFPVFSAAVWGGQLYFGTADGKVCVNTGYVDGVTLADPSIYSPVAWSVLTSYQNLGNGNWKQLQTIRPNILSQTPGATVESTARYDFDLLEPNPPAVTSSSAEGTWDHSTWDSSVWGGDYTPTQPLQGAVGMGRDVAIAVRGTAISRTTLVDIAVTYTQGGPL